MKKKKKKEKCTRVVGSRRVRQDYWSRSIIDKTTTGVLGGGEGVEITRGSSLLSTYSSASA
jgi:hypothetical protein